MKSLVVFSGVLIALFMASCIPVKGDSDYKNIKWVLEKMGTDSIVMSEPPFIVFKGEDNTIFGLAGCNRFFGEYKSDGDNISLSNVGATRMYCPNMQVEDRFLKILNSVNKVEVKGKRLLLKSKDGGLVQFLKEER